MIPRGRTHTILSVLLQEMIARTEKCLLRREIRKVEMQKITMDEQLKVVTVNHFNLLLCHTEESRMYWKKNLKTQLCKKFQGGLSEEEQHVLYDIKGDVVMHELLKRFSLLFEFKSSQNTHPLTLKITIIIIKVGRHAWCRNWSPSFGKHRQLSQRCPNFIK